MTDQLEQITAKSIADTVEDKINGFKELEHSKYYKFSDELANKIEDFAKQEVEKACKHQRYLCADEIKYDPEVESTIIDDFKDSVLNAPQPKD